MGLKPIDVLLVVKYGFNAEREKSCVYTNANPDAVIELLDNWVQDQVGAGSGRDPSPLNEALDLYTIELGYFLADDCFATESDTGNRGMNVGIIMSVIGELRDKTLPIKTLQERPQ